MIVKINKQVVIECTNDEWWDMEEQLRPYLIVENKAYIQKLNLGFSVKNEPQEYSLMDVDYLPNGRRRITLPVGLWDFISQFFDKDVVQDLRPRHHISQITGYPILYPYQREAVLQMTRYPNGILKAAPGSGKTIMGLTLALLKGKSLLWINDRIELCKQARRTAIELLNINPDDCGLLQGDNEVIKPYTFTTIQKLQKVLDEGFKDVSQSLREFDTIIIDECHHCIGSYDNYKTYFQALNELEYKYVYGLTATETRPDGNEHLVFAILGPVRHEVTSQTNTMPATVINKHCYIETDDETYESFINKFTGKAIPALVDQYLLFHDKYLDFITPYFDEVISKYNKVLLVSPRVQGAEWISDYLKSIGVDHYLVHGKIKTGREKMYTAKVIVTTLQLVKEGFDVPDLEAIVVCARNLHKQVKTQVVGRCERYVEGKKDPVAYFLIPHMKPNKQRREWEVLSLEEI